VTGIKQFISQSRTFPLINIINYKANRKTKSNFWIQTRSRRQELLRPPRNVIKDQNGVGSCQPFHLTAKLRLHLPPKSLESNFSSHWCLATLPGIARFGGKMVRRLELEFWSRFALLFRRKNFAIFTRRRRRLCCRSLKRIRHCLFNVFPLNINLILISRSPLFGCEKNFASAYQSHDPECSLSPFLLFSSADYQYQQTARDLHNHRHRKALREKDKCLKGTNINRKSFDNNSNVSKQKALMSPGRCSLLKVCEHLRH
jgi:hypothetical protein